MGWKFFQLNCFFIQVFLLSYNGPLSDLFCSLVFHHFQFCTILVLVASTRICSRVSLSIEFQHLKLKNLIFGWSGCCKDDEHKHKSDPENLEENTKSGILKKAKNVSSKFRSSLRNKMKRRNDTGVCEIQDQKDQKAVDAFRLALVMDSLLPARFDDYHIMLR